MAIKLEVRTQGGWHRFVASFSTEAQALGYAEARKDTHIVSEIESAPIDDKACPILFEYLYPTCHHGLSGDMCMDPYGPHHFGTAEWERQHYGF